MVYLRFSLLLVLPLIFTGCTTYNVGSSQESGPNGSYTGATLNSPVTDQNSHVGGDSSYPDSPNTGKPLADPDKLDGR